MILLAQTERRRKRRRKRQRRKDARKEAYYFRSWLPAIARRLIIRRPITTGFIEIDFLSFFSFFLFFSLGILQLGTERLVLRTPRVPGLSEARNKQAVYAIARCNGIEGRQARGGRRRVERRWKGAREALHCVLSIPSRIMVRG